MKERPILFSAPMVRAILDGRKTQTRRVVKPKVAEILDFLGGTFDADDDRTTDELLGRSSEAKGVRVWCADYPEEGSEIIHCPYGLQKDRIWVRETWAHDAESLEQCRAAYEDAAGGGICYGPYYRATEIAPNTLHWRPSIHMPRWASRITLEVTGVRVERLQDISEADAVAEGITVPVNHKRNPLLRITGALRPDAFKRAHPGDWCENDFIRFEFANLWETINGPGSWAANPWVWVVEFRRLL